MTNEESMWLTYKDYQRDDDRKDILKESIVLLEESLQPINSSNQNDYGAVEIPST